MYFRTNLLSEYFDCVCHFATVPWRIEMAAPCFISKFFPVVERIFKPLRTLNEKFLNSKKRSLDPLAGRPPASCTMPASVE